MSEWLTTARMMLEHYPPPHHDRCVALTPPHACSAHGGTDERQICATCYPDLRQCDCGRDKLLARLTRELATTTRLLTQTRALLEATVEVLDADGIVYGDCTREPLDVLRTSRDLLSQFVRAGITS